MLTPEDRADLVRDLVAALRESHLSSQLSDEEVQWVRLAIQREAQSIKLRQAVIEKTFAGLVWPRVSRMASLH